MNSWYLTVVLCGCAVAASAGSDSLHPVDIGKSVIDLATAATVAEKTDAVSALERLESWKNMVQAGVVLSSNVATMVAQCERLIADFNNKARSPEVNPRLAESYRTRVKSLEQRLDLLTKMGEELEKSLQRLIARITAIEQDPDVQELIETQHLLKQVDTAVSNVNVNLPDSMRL